MTLADPNMWTMAISSSNLFQLLANRNSPTRVTDFAAVVHVGTGNQILSPAHEAAAVKSRRFDQHDGGHTRDGRIVVGARTCNANLGACPVARRCQT